METGVDPRLILKYTNRNIKHSAPFPTSAWERQTAGCKLESYQIKVMYLLSI